MSLSRPAISRPARLLPGRRRSPVLAVAAVALLALACSSPDDGNKPKVTAEGCLLASKDIDCQAKAEVRHAVSGKLVAQGAIVPVQVGALAVGGQVELDFSLVNTVAVATASALRIDAVRLTYEPASPVETASDRAFACFDATGKTPCEDAKWRKVVPAGAEDAAKGLVSQETFRIRYKHFDNIVRKATVCLDLVGDPAFADEPLCLPFETRQGKPKLKVTPTEVVFPYVPLGKSDIQDVALTNVGDAPLVLHQLDFDVDAAFSLQVDDQVHKAGKPFVFSPPVELEPGASKGVKVAFAPVDEKKRTGAMQVQSSDPSLIGGYPVLLLANSAVPCLKITPSPKVAFGAVVLGKDSTREVTLSSCGSEVIDVTSLAIKPGGSGNFAIDWTKAAKPETRIDPKVGPTEKAPLHLGVGASVAFDVIYTPDQLSEVDPATNSPKPDLDTLEVLSNASPQQVQLEGFGVKETCPEAKILVQEGEEVVPQTVLHLKGDGSIAPGGGTIAKYVWEVKKQPEGSSQKFVPSTNFPNPTFTVNAAGEYLFCLDVYDTTGQKSCSQACVTVIVTPSDCLHVEMLWKTPKDPDETDTGAGAGSDVDLHFAHPLSAGPDIDCDGTPDPWFSNYFDAFWFNPTANWGSSALADDDPSLDLDDTDGGGPENLNLALPEGDAANPKQYSVGVHYWNDKGYGEAFATVRVYVCGQLAVEHADVQLKPLDMWYVGRINWPNDKVGGALPVMEDCKQSGSACLAKKDPGNPKAGKMWQATGDKCITPCYSSDLTPAGSAPACKP